MCMVMKMAVTVVPGKLLQQQDLRQKHPAHAVWHVSKAVMGLAVGEP